MFWGEKRPFISAIAACTPSSSQAGTCGSVRALAGARGGRSFFRPILLQRISLGVEPFEDTGLFPEAMRGAVSGGPLVKSDHVADAAAAAGKGAAGLRDRGLPPCGAQLP